MKIEHRFKVYERDANGVWRREDGSEVPKLLAAYLRGRAELEPPKTAVTTETDFLQ